MKQEVLSVCGQLGQLCKVVCMCVEGNLCLIQEAGVLYPAPRRIAQPSSVCRGGLR